MNDLSLDYSMKVYNIYINSLLDNIKHYHCFFIFSLCLFMDGKRETTIRKLVLFGFEFELWLYAEPIDAYLFIILFGLLSIYDFKLISLKISISFIFGLNDVVAYCLSIYRRKSSSASGLWNALFGVLNISLLS